MNTHGENEVDHDTIQRMLAEARAGATRAYAPYSAFPVGASVLTADGRIISGFNIENASYGLTVCGERVAIFRAMVEGYREIRAVAVSAPKLAGTTPCGACRQVMSEVRPAGGDMLVVMDNGVGATPTTAWLRDLLPHSFGPDGLKEQ